MYQARSRSARRGHGKVEGGKLVNRVPVVLGIGEEEASGPGPFYHDLFAHVQMRVLFPASYSK